MIRLFLFISAVMAVGPSLSHAQTTVLPPKVIKRHPAQSSRAKGTQVDANTSVRMNYGYPGWNTSPSKFDSGSLILREGTTGRLVQIHLEETEPDSSIFSGLFAINWQNVETLKVEFYVPPQELLTTPDGLKKIAALIANGQLKKHPFIMRRAANRSQTIEIYDSREQAQMALKAFRAQLQLQGGQNKKFPSDQQLATAETAAALKAKMDAARIEAERIRLEQLEAQRLATMIAKQAELSAAEKAKRKKDAEQIAAEALALYKDGKFKEATDKFEKALELDPDNKSYCFQYGVALYKLENFNKALVYLSLAEGPQVKVDEKDFFIGLAHFRIKEFEKAIGSFDRVAANKTSELAPSALFYKGVANFEQKQWAPARDAFQAVLDTSKDPQLDERAENYLEQILRVQQFELEKSRKWQISVTVGEQYDSNVNSVSDSSLSQGAVSNFDGYRSLLMTSVRYRPVYEQTKEFAAQLDVLTMYTVDTGFQYQTALRNADPTVATFTLPWTYKGLMWGKGYKLDLTPGYESITMSVEDGTPKEIIGSYVFNVANMFVMSDRLFSNFNLEMRNDMNKMASVTGDNDSTATKMKLVNSNLHFLGEEKTKIATSEISYTINTAAGKNATYNRWDVAVGYIAPFYWDTTANAKIGYFNLIYPSKSDNRADSSVTLSLGGSKKLNDTYSAGLSGNYNINSSNVDSYTYKKWTMMLTLSALTAF